MAAHPTEAAGTLGRFITWGLVPITAMALVLTLAFLVHLIAKKIAAKWADKT